MKKTFAVSVLLFAVISTLSGCGPIGDKSMSVSAIYGTLAALSLLIFIGYCFAIKEKIVWFYLLFASIMIVNTGYLALSLAGNLDFALSANRIAYLGSVFLPFSMLMILADACKIKIRRYVSISLVVTALLVFLIAASPGILDIYYSSVSLGQVNGTSILIKEYGSWHSIYLFYLVGYFLTMIVMLFFACAKKKVSSLSHAVFLLIAVLVNIGVWLAEQLVTIEFEMLSVSYIFTELFLIAFYMMIQEKNVRVVTDGSHKKASSQQDSDYDALSEESESNKKERLKIFCDGIENLTATERKVYSLYIEGKNTEQVLSELDIKNNTLKYHNKNIYSKLGVSSKKQLIQTHRELNKNNDA